MLGIFKGLLGRADIEILSKHEDADGFNHYSLRIGKNSYYLLEGTHRTYAGCTDLYALEHTVDGLPTSVRIKRYDNGAEEITCDPPSEQLETTLRTIIEYIQREEHT